MKGHSCPVFSVTFSSDNRCIVSGSENDIRLWNTQTYTYIGEFTGHTGYVLSVAFSADGQWITSGSDDHALRVWHCNTAQLVLLEGHINDVSSAVFSPDDGRLISGGLDNTIRIWSKPNKEWPILSEQITTVHLSQHSHPAAPPFPHTISLEDNPSVVAACYSPDRTHYAGSTLDGRVFFWNIAHNLLWESATLIRPLRMSADWLIMSSPDGSLWAWDMVGGRPTRHTPHLDHSSIRRISINSECKAAHLLANPSFSGFLSR